MRIPKYIEKLLNRREKLAYQLNDCSIKIDKFLQDNGADLLDPSICDSTATGCMIYCEPTSAKNSVITYILNDL